MTAAATSDQSQRSALIWLLPALAALVGWLLLLTVLAQRGPEITVIFRSAEGLSPGKTALRYKSKKIGMLKSLRPASNRAYVIATIELSKDADSLLARDTRFWVVRPRLTGSGIAGWESLWSASYIGVDAGKSTTRARHFIGLEQAPALSSDVSGKQVRLRLCIYKPEQKLLQAPGSGCASALVPDWLV